VLATTEELQRYLDLSDEGEVDGALLGILLESASVVVARYTGRTFEPEPKDDGDPMVLKTFPLRHATPRRLWDGTRGLAVPVPDLREVGLVSVAGSTVAEGEYEHDATDDEPARELVLHTTFASIPRGAQLQVSGRWGFAKVPADVRDVALLIAARAYREKDAAFADSVSTMEGGGLSYTRTLPARARMVLDSYRTPRVAFVRT
jgi:hypothetical protein